MILVNYLNFLFWYLFSVEQLQWNNDEQKAKILKLEQALKVAEVCELPAICS